MDKEQTLNAIEAIKNQEFDPTWYQSVGHFINTITFNAFDKIGLFNSYDSNKRDFAINQLGQLGQLIEAANKGSQNTAEWLKTGQVPYAKALADDYDLTFQDLDKSGVVEMPYAGQHINHMPTYLQGDIVTYKYGEKAGKTPYEYSETQFEGKQTITPTLKITDPAYREFADKIYNKLNNVRLENETHNAVFSAAANAQYNIKNKYPDIFGAPSLN